MSVASYFVILKQITTQQTFAGLQDVLETSSRLDQFFVFQDIFKIWAIQIWTTKCDLNK